MVFLVSSISTFQNLSILCVFMIEYRYTMDSDSRDIKVVIDTDHQQNYEVNNFLRKAINLFLIPILNRLPRRLFVGSGKRAKTVHEHAATHRALEVIYSFDHKLRFDKGILDGFMAYFWLKTNNAKALRNRLRLVKKELEKTINSLNKKEIRILNLACGSNRAIIEIVGRHKDNFDFEVFAVDKNELALEDARKLANLFDIHHLFNCHQDTVSKFLERNHNAKFDIIEMVGFLDYLNDEKAINLFNQIYSNLTKKGVFISGNIKDNPEKKFVIEVVGWPNLIFRNESDLINLLMNSKFKSSEIKIVYEPQNIHGVVVCKKL